MGMTMEARQSLGDFDALLQHDKIEHRMMDCHCRISFHFFQIVAFSDKFVKQALLRRLSGNPLLMIPR